MKKILLLLSFSSCLFSMEQPHVIELHNVSLNTFSLRNYYSPESKTLDLSNLPVGDDGFSQIFEHIKHFIQQYEVSNLILENMDLTSIPYGAISFALLNPKVRYMSFKNNRFNISITDPSEKEFRLTLPELHKYTGIRKFSDPSMLRQDLELTHPEHNPRSLSFMADLLSSVWKSITPEIESELDRLNTGSNRLCFFKKIIEIDSKLPPLTIIDSSKLPRTKAQTMFSLLKKTALILIGAGISVTPQIIIALLGEPEFECADLDYYIQLCNSTL